MCEQLFCQSVNNFYAEHFLELLNFYSLMNYKIIKEITKKKVNEKWLLEG